MPSIRWRRIEAISSGLISIYVNASLRRAGDALSKFLQPVSDARVDHHVADLEHEPAEDALVDAALDLHLVAGLLLDLGTDPLDDLGIELDSARHSYSEPLVLLGPEGVELAADPEQHRHPVLLGEQVQEVHQLR